MKGLLVHLYRSGPPKAASANVIHVSGAAQSAILVGDGIEQVHESGPKHPAIRLTRRMGHLIAVPDASECPDANVWVGPMFGGTFVAATDERFSQAVGGLYAAIPLHDRFERGGGFGGD